jgi:hypothetical protein
MVRTLREATRIAKGVRRANYTKAANTANAWTQKPESEWVLSEVEAVVPAELWNNCKFGS